MARRKKSVDEQLKQARQRIAAAKKFRKDERLDDDWDRYVQLYRGRKQSDGDVVTRDIVNVAFSTINVIFPSVSVNNPYISVKARKEMDGPRGIIVEAVTNYVWRHYKFQSEVRRAVKDSLIVGHGWVKVGHRFKEEDAPLTDEDADAELQTRIAEADAYAEGNPDLAGSLPTDEEIESALPESKVVVKEDRPFVERVSFKDIFVDPDATCVADMTWIAQRMWRPLEDVKRDEDYSRSVRNSVEPSKKVQVESDRKDDTADQAKLDNTVAWVCLWEFYDIVRDQWHVFAETGDGFLKAPEAIPFATGHPFRMFGNYTIPDDEFYPMGEIENIEILSEELNSTREDLFRARRKYRAKYLYRESAFNSADALDALKSTEDNVMVPVTGDDPLVDVLVPLRQESALPDFYNQSELIESDIDRSTGVNEYQRGGMPEIRRTATEAAIASDASNARAADKLGMVEDTTADIASAVIAVLQQFMTGEMAARVVGPDGEDMWFTFDKNWIAGEYDFEVEAGSTQPNNESIRRQSAMQMVDACAPFAEVINQQEMVRYILQQGFGIKNPERFIMAAPPMLPTTPGQPTAPGGGEAPPVPPLPQNPNMAALPPELLNQLQGQVDLPAQLAQRLADTTPIPAPPVV